MCRGCKACGLYKLLMRKAPMWKGWRYMFLWKFYLNPLRDQTGSGWRYIWSLNECCLTVHFKVVWYHFGMDSQTAFIKCYNLMACFIIKIHVFAPLVRWWPSRPFHMESPISLTSTFFMLIYHNDWRVNCIILEDTILEEH